ncbi:YhgE/Pip family protein [Frondihabitans australicus]|uniref:Putative membrane protein n=1 Tax=Frondihabitans australicus TaxID=386892 RepID=A0A495IJK3_9MICO|nr:YhgE/Pip domain-containing protein [Frondihabitans australicus]RKR76147.1 putative membrane protein [Frondihabitans australicus]
MKIVTLVRSELARLTASSLARLAFVALMTVPLLYGGMYLWANQNPYAKLDHIPAAIVNQDSGGTDSAGHAVNYGDKVEKQLVDGKDFDWHVVSASQAASGLAAETYDFVFTIPSSFSRDLTSASSTDPTAAKIHLTTNDTTSYLSSTIADQAGNTIRAAVTAEVGKTAAKTLLVGLNDVRTNLATAADGSQKLVDGATKLKSGLDTASAASATLSSGAASLASGAASLNGGLQSLKSQTAALPSQTQQLATGAAQVAQGDKSLASSVDDAASTAQKTVDGLPAAKAAATAAQTKALTAIFTQAAEAGTPFTPEQQRLIEGYATSAGEASYAQLSNAANAANGQLKTLKSATDQLATGSAQVSGGAATLAASAPALTSGISQAASGSEQVSSGAASVASGAASLKSGLGTLDTGAGQLVDGTAKLTGGLNDGVKKIPATTAATRDKQAAAIADPVSIKDSSIASAGNYGAGLAPFFISLAAWIGMYALFLIIKPISKRAITAIKAPARITLAGWLTPVVLGVVQMLALFAIVKFALGFDVHSWPGMIGIMILASATFAAIIMMLNVLLGSVGQFLGLVLMLIQLVTAGGTFPWQTLPGPLAALHFALPMSYAVDGIRQLMYGGSGAAAGHDALVLLAWLLGALLVTFVAARRMTKSRTLRDLRPSLIG